MVKALFRISCLFCCILCVHVVNSLGVASWYMNISGPFIQIILFFSHYIYYQLHSVRRNRAVRSCSSVPQVLLPISNLHSYKCSSVHIDKWGYLCVVWLVVVGDTRGSEWQPQLCWSAPGQMETEALECLKKCFVNACCLPHETCQSWVRSGQNSSIHVFPMFIVMPLCYCSVHLWDHFRVCPLLSPTPDKTTMLE